MTCGIGIVDTESVWLAADSAASCLSSGEIYTLKTAKVFQRGPYGFAYTTSYRLGQILRYETELPEPPDVDLERFMATEFVRVIRRSFEDAGFVGGLGEHGSILVGVRGALFAIGAELQVGWPATPYAAVGCGRHIAYGALYALEGSGKPARERALVALRAAQKFSPAVREPFNFVQVYWKP